MYIVGELLGLLFGFLFSTLLLIGTTWQRLLQCDLDSQNNFGFTILRVLREFILTAFLRSVHINLRIRSRDFRCRARV